jgi:cytochrome c-type biogenesis protein
MIDIALALLAGVLTIAAPCILPMLPILLGSAMGQTSRTRPLFLTLGFVTAFSATALMFNAFSSALGLSQDVLRDIAIALLMTFGILMVWPRYVERLVAPLAGIFGRINAIGDRAGPGNLGGFVLGMTIGAVWTPCAGPVLGTILTLVATAQDAQRATLLLVCYATGAGLPMLAIAYGGQYMSTRVRRLARLSRTMQQAFGGLIVMTAIAMYFQYDTLITVWLSDLYPDLTKGF